MINTLDNFLDKETYDATYQKLLDNEFIEISLGDKVFRVQNSDKDFNDMILKKISYIEGVERECLLGFFRVATEDFDTDWRIHADSNVGDITPERALVLYISPSKKKGLHGTAFWKHKDKGYQIPDDFTNEEFDTFLLEESNNLDSWELHSVIGYRPNRALMYPCAYFHSKYPNTGWEGGRMVYVMFYK